MTPDAPWITDAGQWPLPWLQEAAARATAQRGHALVIHGPEGVGQFELALCLAQNALCEAHEVRSAAAVMACGRCEGCRLIHAGTHPDLKLLLPESLRQSLPWWGAEEDSGQEAGSARASAAKSPRAGREIRVSDVRAAIQWASTTPSRAGRKVLVIAPAGRLNITAANALLKTIEEPPASLQILLAAGDLQALLPTLRSRCQRVALDLPSRQVAIPWLAGQGVDLPEIMLDAAGGRPQLAVEMLKSGLDARAWSHLPQSVKAGRCDALIAAGLPQSISALQKLCMDLSALCLGNRPNYFPPESLPTGASLQALSAWWTRLMQAARHDEHPVNAALLTESLVLAGQACWPRPSKSHVR